MRLVGPTAPAMSRPLLEPWQARRDREPGQRRARLGTPGRATPQLTLIGHFGAVGDASFSPDGRARRG